MAGYSSTPLYKKLGLKPGMRATAVNAPSGYTQRLDRPKGADPRWEKTITSGVELVHFFGTRKADLAKTAKACRAKLAPAGSLWVSWPKQSSGVPTEITEDIVRDVVLPLGLVDIKVCAVDEIWSGL
jgi:hypothetical protein